MQSVLIVANGGLPKGFHLEHEIKKYATVVALDGAANRLAQSGLFPDVVWVISTALLKRFSSNVKPLKSTSLQLLTKNEVIFPKDWSGCTRPILNQM